MLWHQRPHQSPTTIRYRVAVHEAGHAVAAHVVGCRVAGVALFKRAWGVEGLCQSSTNHCDEDEAVVSSAGDAAQQHILGFCSSESFEDHEAVAKLCLTDLALRRVESRTRAIVSAYANEIMTLAKALEYAGRLEGDRLTEMLGRLC